MTRFYCTYFDKNYLVRALALIESLHHHEHHDFVLYAVCMDELSRAMLERLALKNVIPVPFHQIEYGDDQLISTKATRSLLEYYWTSTPTIILYLIEQYPEIEVLTYLDADLFFFSTPDPIFHELGQQSILLHEHRFSSSTMHLAVNNGKYNVGLLCFRNDTHGMHALRWWRERCLEWCFSRYEDGKLGDQMYLNDWPTRFPQVVELQHVGGGLGPWNHQQYVIRTNDSHEALVNDLPVIFYHFHALRFVNPEIIVPVVHLSYPMNLSVLHVCYLPYISALSRGIQTLKTILPEFECGLRSEDNISPRHILFAKARFAEALKAKGLPQILMRMNTEWNYYCPEETKGLTEFVESQGADVTRQPHAEDGLLHENATAPLEFPPNSQAGIHNQYELFGMLQESPFVEKIQTLYIIGAHMFQEREMLLSMLPNLQHIYLFEPIPDCYRYLKTFESQDSRIQVFPYALSQADGTAEFFLTDNQGESSSLLPMGKHREVFPEVHHVHTIKVETRRLERVMQEYHLVRPDMLFLDVQGAEYQILSSLSEDLLSQIHLIYAEASLEEFYQGSKTLQDMRTLLDPYFEFSGYSPMSDQTPTHGNALFANRGKVPACQGTIPMISDKGEPLISVIVSTYNSVEFIRECLEDLERQTVIEHMEIIVVDAASQQDERIVVEEFQERFRNIVYIRTSTKITVYAAWNLAIRAARGKYITPFSTNDRLRKDAYEILMHALEEHPEIPLVYGDSYLTRIPHEIFEEHTRCGEWKWPEYSFEDLLRNCRVGPHPMWKKMIHDQIGYFDEQYHALGDQEFWLRMGEQFQLLHIPEFTGLYWMTQEGFSNQRGIADREGTQISSLYWNRHQGRLSALRRGPYECTIIIPVFNKVELTRQCLTHLVTVTKGISYEVIVVDNASTDETGKFLVTLSGDVRIIRNEEKQDFAKACNQGARDAKGRHLVFLNNDMLPKEGWLQALVDEVETNPDVAVVGSKLLSPVGKIQHAGVAFPRTGLIPYHMYRGFPAEQPAVNRCREFQAVTAACMLVRRTCFEMVGGFDEGFRNGYEDVDLCLKIREKGGRIIYQPRSVLSHLEGQTEEEKTFESQNVALLIKKWGHTYLADEDCIAVSDGDAVDWKQEGQTAQPYVIPLRTEQERACWERVAQVQTMLREMGTRPRPDGKGTSVCAPELEQLFADIKVWPQDWAVLRWGGTVCRELGLPHLAEAFWRRTLGLGEDVASRIGLARGAIEQANFDEAQEHLSKLLTQLPDHGEGWLFQGILAMQQENYDQAGEAFEKAFQFGGDARKVQLGLGMAWMGQEKPEQAWGAFLHVLEQHPDDTDAVQWLLRAGTAMEWWDDLAEHLSNFLARNPAHVAIRYALAGIEVRRDHLDAAQHQHDTLQLLSPDTEGLEELLQAINEASAVSAGA